MDSIVNQTLCDIQIICINDGSTDSTLSILQEYAAKDPRVEIIDKANSGYGDSMNRGIERATGEYLGIVESDDYVELTMFETLYNAAVKNKLDVVKTGFYLYSTQPEVKNEPMRLAAKIAGKSVFCPLTDFSNPRKQLEFFKSTAAIWSAIYRREFIMRHDIRFNETPGASYQDVGFCFKTWIKAKRVQFLDICLLHYRIDNAQSSVHNPGKVYCICDEYQEMERFLRMDADQLENTMPILASMKYEDYLWNYERLSETLREAFLQRFYEELKRHKEEGTLRRSYFSWYDWNNIQKLLLDPDHYHKIQCQKLRGEASSDFYDAYPQHRPIKIKSLYYLTENLAGFARYMETQGLKKTVNLFVSKVKGRLPTEKTREKDHV